MKQPGMSLDQRRARLAIDIAQQRGDLAVALRNLGKPFQYTEYAMRGYGFFRQNPWVFSVVPACFTIASALFGVVKKGKSSKLTRGERQRLEQLERDRLPKGWTGRLLKLGGHGWNIFKIYRRVRPFFS